MWPDCKRYVRKKVCKTEAELVRRIQKYFKYKLTVQKCQNFISHLIKVGIFYKKSLTCGRSSFTFYLFEK